MEPENDTGVEGVFQYLAREMANVSSALNAQGVSQIVQCFDGNPKNFRDWVKQIEKYCKLTGLPEARKRLIAYQSSKGAVSGFINRYMEAFPQSTWAKLKTELANKFSDVTDSRYALSLLRSIRQKPGENIQLYAERILSLAEEAFVGQGGDVVERQLIDTFVDGLVGNDALKMKILRDNPDTLQGAIATATKEQNLRARANLSSHYHSPYKSDRKEEPMEIDHYRPLRCFKCKKTGHSSKTCRNVHLLNDAKRKNPNIICWGCGQEGHILRLCKQDSYGRTERPRTGQEFRQTQQEN